ncbi:MAG: CheR family methyltransferase [Alkalispirochaetaceae bacterium]
MSDSPITRSAGTSVKLTDKQFGRLQHFIESELGIRMPPVKKVMLESRLQKRLRLLQLQDFEVYLDLAFSEKERAGELIHLIDLVTTNKTDFFREADHFEILKGRLLPYMYLQQGIGRGQPLQVWSAASSTGEEPYTLAIVLAEFARENSGFNFHILGTDISTRVLEAGRKAIYPEERIAPIADELRKRYLLRSKDSEKRLVRIRPALRKHVSFQRQNLMDDRYEIRGSFDIVFCRNVIIYFERPNQQRILTRLVRYLKPGGYLFLGHSETLAGMNLNLTSVAPTVYQKPV